MKPAMELLLDPLRDVELEVDEFDQNLNYILNHSLQWTVSCDCDGDSGGGNGGSDDGNDDGNDSGSGQGSPSVFGIWRKSHKGLTWDWVFPRH